MNVVRRAAVGAIVLLAVPLDGSDCSVKAQDPTRPQPRVAPADPRAADRQAVQEAARAFDRAFESADAQAVAAFWTDGGEMTTDDGETLRGRPAIEAAFAAFFKKHPKPQVEVRIESIRFPAKDLAIEEGTLRTVTGDPVLGTSSTYYSTLHVREGGQWKIATSREWGAAQPKLADLEWLVGDWKYEAKTRRVAFQYRWNETRTRILGRFSVADDGQTVSSGSITILHDPAAGELHSWMFDDEGGRGESVWHRDGARWALETVGVLPDGSRTTATNLVSPLGPDRFQWRSTHRTIAGDHVPDTEPVLLDRVPPAK